MRWRKFEFGALVVVALGSAVVLHTGRASGAEPPKPPPPWDAVERIVQKHFASLPKHRDGYIIARGDVTPLFTQLEAIGWKVADRAEILSAVLTEGSFLVRNLRTANGRKFMQKIASYPEGYDRTDRLSRLNRGHASVHNMINDVGGSDIIKYLTTSTRGMNMARRIERGPKGRNFTEPTGRIYTAKALLARLKESHQEAVHAAETVQAGK